MIVNVTTDVMKHRKKSDLPARDCVVCGRPFVWRKKWAAVWDEVRYCSERCRRAKLSLMDSSREPGALTSMETSH